MWDQEVFNSIWRRGSVDRGSAFPNLLFFLVYANLVERENFENRPRPKFFSACARLPRWPCTGEWFSYSTKRGLCALHHGIQMEAILACHPALSKEWLDWVANSCELWCNQTSPISYFQPKVRNIRTYWITSRTKISAITGYSENITTDYMFLSVWIFHLGQFFSTCWRWFIQKDVISISSKAMCCKTTNFRKFRKLRNKVMKKKVFTKCFFIHTLIAGRPQFTKISRLRKFVDLQ